MKHKTAPLIGGTCVSSRTTTTRTASRTASGLRSSSPAHRPAAAGSSSPAIARAADAASSLDAQIAAFTPEEQGTRQHQQPASRLSSRLQHAIDRLRWHICGVFGVKATEVSDAHVAKFLARMDDDYLFRALPGVGIQTEDDLRDWGRAHPSMEVSKAVR